MLALVLATAITNGSASSDAAVVPLDHGDVLVCTGTVIAPQLVLTAAHCLADAVLPDIDQQPATAAFVHPQFDAASLDHDLALLLIDPPLALTPLPYAQTLTAPQGSTLRVIGFGLTSADDTSPPMRRTGTSQLDAITELRLQSSPSPSQPCEGDSGGPALFDETIVGVASYGDAGCAAGAQHTRVDIHAGFISDVIAKTSIGGAGPGDRCWYAANCATGTCTPALDDPRLSFCATPCDAGCASGLSCIAGLCRHPAPSPGALGSVCLTASDCVDNLCIAPAGEPKLVCTTHCFTDLPGFTCPADTTCRDADDNQQACFAPPPSGGCSIAQPGWLVALLVIRKTRRSDLPDRRRRLADRRARRLARGSST